MNSFYSVFQGLEDLAVGIATPIVLGLSASIARISQNGWRGLRDFLQQGFVSCFVAVCVHWGLDYCDFASTVNAAIIGGSSYFSTVILDALRYRLDREIRERRLAATETKEPQE